MTPRKYFVKAGDRYGKLVVHGEPEKIKGRALSKCLCDCGNYTWLTPLKLVLGHTRSCGCLKRETMKKVGQASGTHRLTDTPTYRTWSSMKSRCSDAKLKHYARYGGAGIRVCERWQSFDLFLADMGLRPEGKTLDRIDNNGDYCPENCRWATASEQQRNTRANVWIELNGVKKTVVEWSEETGLPHNTILGRYHKGDKGESLIRPAHKGRKANHV